MRLQVGPKDRPGAEAVPGVQEPVLEHGSQASPEEGQLRW